MHNTFPIRFIRLPEVLRLTGISKSNLFLKIKNKQFPPSISLGARATGWVQQEVEQTLTAMVAGSSKAQIKELVCKLIQQRQSTLEVRHD